MFYTFRCTLKRYALLSLALLLAGCSSIDNRPLVASAPGAHKIAIFFDGTHNDIASDTNIKRLHVLISLQDKPDISSIYIEGVGTGLKAIGREPVLVSEPECGLGMNSSLIITATATKFIFLVSVAARMPREFSRPSSTTPVS